MGQRSIKTTKSGKYKNPTEQARKEARRQELKKNKVRRQMLRAAVLKAQDPQQILQKMKELDQIEYNVNQPSSLSQEVLDGKRKKLRDTLERILIQCSKDDPEKWADLKRRQKKYEEMRKQLVAFYESVKCTQHVNINEIPLPPLPQQPVPSNTAAEIPLPITERKQEHAIYSIETALKLQALGQPVREPPGCPPGPPPDINDDGEVATDSKVTTVKLTSPQQKMVVSSGQNVNEVGMKIETVRNKLDTTREEYTVKFTPQIKHLTPLGASDPIPTLSCHGSSNYPVPQPHMFISTGIRSNPPTGWPLMPPGPPPGLPSRLPLQVLQVIPRMNCHPSNLRDPQSMQLKQSNFMSAAPKTIERSGKQDTTISAKPQIKKPRTELTRFIPSVLRVKREGKKPKQNAKTLIRELKQTEYNMHQNAISQHNNKDDAYKQFMHEIEELL